MALELTTQELEKFTKLAYNETGIRISSQKLELMRNRLGKRLSHFKLNSYQAYYDYLMENWAEELPHFIESITTNETYFFRAPRHFFLMSKTVFPQMPDGNVDIWSSACSSGEEPYSLAIALLERLKNVKSRRIRIYASDIDRKVLKKASEGIFGDYALRFVRPNHLKKYFTPLGDDLFQVVPEIRKMVLFGQHNIQTPFPKGKMDLVFCRNVLIYFDDISKAQVLKVLTTALKLNGYLFLGESEIVPDVPGLSRIEGSVARKVS